MRCIALAAGILLASASTVCSQPVEVSQLAAPDAFSTSGRDTGLGADLWKGSAIELVRAGVATVAAKPLPPAYAELARRALATGAQGPTGAADDAGLAGARINALVALGDLPAARRILERAPNMDRSPELARAAAETALLAGDETSACRVAERLSVDRDDIYWLRLRAYCQAVAGQTDAARLTLDLAQEQSRDVVFGRLMAAKLSGAAPGAPSLRNGLDYVLSKSAGLDLAAAKPSPAVAAALAGAAPTAPTFESAVLDPTAAIAAVAAETDPKARTRLQAAALMSAALAPGLSGADRAGLAAFTLAEGRGSAGRDLLLDDATARRIKGEVVLVGLMIGADAGTVGPAPADRARFARGLMAVGLAAEARLIVLEGLAGLK